MQYKRYNAVRSCATLQHVACYIVTFVWLGLYKKPCSNNYVTSRVKRLSLSALMHIGKKLGLQLLHRQPPIATQTTYIIWKTEEYRVSKNIELKIQRYKFRFLILFYFCLLCWHRRKLTNVIIWEMHGFSHQSPTLRENATKPMVWEKSGKLVLILFPWHECFFSHQNPILWYNSSHGKCIIFHNIGKDSRTYRMGKLWEIGFQQYPTKPIKCGKRGKLLLILFPQYWGPFLLDSYPMVCFITCEMDGFHHQTPHSIKKSIKWRRPGNLVPILFR